MCVDRARVCVRTEYLVCVLQAYSSDEPRGQDAGRGRGGGSGRPSFRKDHIIKVSCDKESTTTTKPVQVLEPIYDEGLFREKHCTNRGSLRNLKLRLHGKELQRLKVWLQDCLHLHLHLRLCLLRRLPILHRLPQLKRAQVGDR